MTGLEQGQTAPDLQEFFDHFRATAETRGRLANLSPFQLVDRWRLLVADIVAGYDDDLYAYENELDVRACLERALAEESLLRWDSWRGLVDEIERADADLKAALEHGPRCRRCGPWWTARLPPNVDDEFRAETESRFGVLWADVAANDALFCVEDLLDRVPRSAHAPSWMGASLEQLAQAETELGAELPPVLRAWLRHCNGAMAGPGLLLGVRTPDPAFDAVTEQARWPGWRARRWLPVATDGSGNAYVVELTPGAGEHPVYFADAAEPDAMDYGCASDLPHFLAFLLQKELGEDRWPFDEAYVLERDPAMADPASAPLPWQP